MIAEMTIMWTKRPLCSSRSGKRLCCAFPRLVISDVSGKCALPKMNSDLLDVSSPKKRENKISWLADQIMPDTCSDRIHLHVCVCMQVFYVFFLLLPRE